jgi:hypothetical protein
MKNKSFFFFSLLIFLFSVSPCFAQNDIEYQLHKNYESYGIVVFPKRISSPELDTYIKSIDFEPVESGKAAMRFGPKGENQTYMMPLEVQKKYAIKKFIVVQVLPDHRLMIGIYDPEWGLTLISTIYSFEEVKKNIPKTLDVFRGANKKKEIFLEPQFPN